MEWQPIETAPKDGTRILVMLVDTGTVDDIAIAAWDDFDDRGVMCWATETGEGWTEVSHWMPLPQPPK